MPKTVVPNLFGTRGQFQGKKNFHRLRVGFGFRMIQEYYNYYAAADLTGGGAQAVK